MSFIKNQYFISGRIDIIIQHPSRKQDIFKSIIFYMGFIQVTPNAAFQYNVISWQKGGITVLGCKAVTESYTQARKAQKILEGYGYKCLIKRTTNTGIEGCGFMLIVNGDCTEVSDILVSSGVAYKRLENLRRYEE